jgi:hypothetical protein
LTSIPVPRYSSGHRKGRLKFLSISAFAYVDGDHAYEQARKDVDNVCAHLVPRGLILLDDTADDSPFGCKRVVPELIASGFEVVWNNPNYLVRAPG